MLSRINYCLKENKQALLVEDEPINQIVSSKILEKIGFTVSFASNGIEAITSFENHEFDIVFMDLQMPFMDGFEATRKIREKNTTVPIVALTASIIIEEMSKSQKQGMNGFLQKPIQDDKLKQSVASFFEIYEYSPVEEKAEKNPNSAINKSEKQKLRDCIDEVYNKILNGEFIKSTKI